MSSDSFDIQGPDTSLGQAYLSLIGDASREFDSRIFWFCGGAATLSVAALTQLTTSQPDLCWLLVGWIALLLAALLTLAGLQLTVIQCNAFYMSMQPGPGRLKAWETGENIRSLIVWVNWIAYALASLGSFALLLGLAKSL